MPDVHSKYSPSAANRWMNCPGSIQLIDALPEDRKIDKVSFYAEEGTVAHLLASTCLSLGVDAIDFKGEKLLEGSEIEVDADMVEHVQMYLDKIAEETPIADKDEGKYLRDIEVKVVIDEENDVFGTVDFALYVVFDNTLTIIDFKYGVEPVDVEENSQLLSYGVGFLKQFKNVDKIRLMIVQPRAKYGDPIKVWSTTKSRISKHKADMKEAIALSKVENPPFKMGDWCKYCKGKIDCPEMRKTALDVARTDFSADLAEYEPPKVELLTTQQISFILNVKPALEKFLDDVKAYGTKIIVTDGGEIPGFEEAPGRSSRSWKDENTVISKLEPLFGEEIYTPQTLLSPAQMEKIGDDKKTMKKIVEALQEKTIGNPTIRKKK